MDETVSLRVAETGDAAAIHALVHEAYAKWIPLIGRLPTPMQADYADAVTRHRFALLHVGAAFAALVETAADADHLTIENLAVRPPFQGRGLGRLLLRHAEDLAAASGLSEMRLWTNKKYTENLRLYASQGYRVAREEPYTGAGRTLDDDITVYMAKALVPG